MLINFLFKLLVLYLYEFTLLSNYCSFHTHCFLVLYLYEFTLLSNNVIILFNSCLVLYLYEFTLLSNAALSSAALVLSYTSMNLHYSQTCRRSALSPHVLYLYEFTLLSNEDSREVMTGAVLYLYEFTLLSNGASCSCWVQGVLYLYEFTLLSNLDRCHTRYCLVLYLYEFTLLSNRETLINNYKMSYTSMNLHYSQTSSAVSSAVSCLIPLWIYITLKQNCDNIDMLKVLYLYEFTLLSNYILRSVHHQQSYTSMNLHYSQTVKLSFCVFVGLIPLWIYITLKLILYACHFCKSLIPLWIYITLKHL